MVGRDSNDRANDSIDAGEHHGAAAAREISKLGADDSFDLATQVAPSFPGVFHPSGHWTESPGARPPDGAPQEGDFEVLRELGRGASGVVYLARQRSLGRAVALKVTHNVGTEAKTMATLEHRHIVQVFSETVSQDGNLRLICMQYVPGITVATLVGRLRDLAAGASLETAPELADVIAGDDVEMTTAPDTTAIPQKLLRFPRFVQQVCRVVADVADALAHAHRHGVLHRDIKPANILIDQAARPLLADFSLSRYGTAADNRDELFGGTLAFMAPEHLDALDRATPEKREAVDEVSDIYSLGLVLYELLTLERPLMPASDNRPLEQIIRDLADRRRERVPRIEHRASDVAPALNWILAKCLAPDPTERFDDAAELAAALRGCEHLSRSLTELPSGRFTRWLRSRPMFGPSLLCGVANLAAVAVGVAYIYSTRRLTAPGIAGWPLLVWFALHIVAATGVDLAFAVSRIRRILPIFDGTADRCVDAQSTREQLIRLPSSVALVTLLVWLPNYVACPLFIYLIAPSWTLTLEFLIAYTVGMLIAVCTTYFVSEFTALRTYYPYAWTDTRRISKTANLELTGVTRRIRPFQLLSAVVPISGAVAIVMVGPEFFAQSGYFTFRVLAVTLIVGGLLGLLATGAVRAAVEQMVRLFTGKAR